MKIPLWFLLKSSNVLLTHDFYVLKVPDMSMTGVEPVRIARLVGFFNNLSASVVEIVSEVTPTVTAGS